jgi:tRNA(Ile)-lysidine synthase TilS/MesJ
MNAIRGQELGTLPVTGAPAPARIIAPPKSILRLTGRAIGDYAMIRPGDRILLGLSGGKDSLSLLHVLLHLRAHAPVRFELGVATVDPGIDGYDPAPLRAVVGALGLPFFLMRQAIVKRALDTMRGDSFCAYCARMRRGMLYRVAREHGYQVLALAQHLDDLAESFLMSVLHGGRLKTMKAHYENDAGDVRVIRPFVYVRERQLAEFARSAALPVIHDNCPACFRVPTERMRVKALLAGEEERDSRVFLSILSAMRPLMAK